MRNMRDAENADDGEGDLHALKCCTQFTDTDPLALTTESPKYLGSISARIIEITVPSYSCARDVICLGRLNVFT
jgi:hypothetical protein